MSYHRPERRFEVFISSTFVDLVDVRKRISQEIIKCGHIPIGMEAFPAGPQDVEHINDCIAKADIFVILVGARYGQRVPKVGGHFLSLEYREAVRLKKPILAYLLEDREYQETRSLLKNTDPERANDRTLASFRKLLKKDSDGHGRLIGYFSLREARKNQLIDGFRDALQPLAAELTKHGEGGWVRSEIYDELRGRGGLSEIVSRNPFFGDFVKRLDQFDVLSSRIVASGEQHSKLARYFLDTHLGWLIDHKVHSFFFESGSTIAYLSRAFISSLHTKHWLKEVSPELRIHTNNIITYLDFGLSEDIHVELYPFGPPEKKYGATFGSLTSLTELSPGKVLEAFHHTLPTADATARDEFNPKERWEEEAERIEKWFRKNYEHNGIILMTASGLDTDPQSRYHGPHVGSYYNMLFKRAILRSGCPAVMFLNEEKVLVKPFDEAECYPICDKSVPWVNVCRNNPFCVAVHCENDESVERIKGIFVELGLTKVERSPRKPYTLILSNAKFQARFGEKRPRLPQTA